MSGLWTGNLGVKLSINNEHTFHLPSKVKNILQKEGRVENLSVSGFLKPQWHYRLELLPTSLIAGLLAQLHGVLSFHKARVSLKIQGEYRTWKVDFKKYIGKFEYMKMSSASLIFQTLINGLLFSTSVYSSIGSCHLDVPLSGYSHPCESGNQDFQKPLRGTVKDLGWLLVLEQGNTLPSPCSSVASSPRRSSSDSMSPREVPSTSVDRTRRHRAITLITLITMKPSK